jgi:hypothetical protein
MTLSIRSNRRDVTHLAAPRRASQIMFTPSERLFSERFSADMAHISGMALARAILANA